jgi:hypothetical protein
VEAAGAAKYVDRLYTPGSSEVMVHKKAGIAALIAGLVLIVSGCTERWIEEPSPQVQGLVNDLKLDGFKCKAASDEIVCKQGVPFCEKQPALCDSKNVPFCEKNPSMCVSQNGCIAQPYFLIYNLYFLKQQGNGLPTIRQEIERKRDDASFCPDKTKN